VGMNWELITSYLKVNYESTISALLNHEWKSMWMNFIHHVIMSDIDICDTNNVLSTILEGIGCCLMLLMLQFSLAFNFRLSTNQGQFSSFDLWIIWCRANIFYVRMDGKALQYVLQPFHTFFVQFDATMTHNILVFMLDPKYKG
jgi:hypothetical protein